MKNSKKLLAIILVVLIAVSALSVSLFATSATVNADGTYTPTNPATKTRKVYCAMPGAWINEGSHTTGDSIGCYWWSGTDAAGALDGSGGLLAWPGYRADKVTDQEGIENLFSMQVPTDVNTVVWNNYLCGGTKDQYDKGEAPYFYDDLQTADTPIGINGYCEDDDTYYDEVPGFWDEINDAFENDELEKRYGENGKAFYDDPTYGLTMGFENMIWVVNLDPAAIEESDLNPGQYEYQGEWFFYYGNGEYGSWPTKELNDAHKDDGVTVFGNIMDDEYYKSSAQKLHTPKDGNIYFDADSAGWKNYKNAYCYIWQYGGDEFYRWGNVNCQMTDEGDGIWSYDLTRHNISFDDDEDYAVIFSNNNGMMTYDLLIGNECIGDTAYCDGLSYESPSDSNRSVQTAYWRHQDPEKCGPVLTITSIGNVVGTCERKNVTKEKIFVEFLSNSFYNARAFTDMTDQEIIDNTAGQLGLSVEEVEKAIEEADIQVNWDAESSTISGEAADSDVKYVADYLAEHYNDVALTCQGVAKLLEEKNVTADKVLELVYNRHYDYKKFSAIENLLTPQQGDVNNDGIINVVDATEIQKYAAGLPSVLG